MFPELREISEMLTERSADSIEHPGGTLLAHLLRVETLLGEWGASAEIRLAGLCHAAYGTDGFATALFTLNERAVVREAIGEDAESLVYVYGSCDRAASYPLLSEPAPVFTDRFTGAEYRPGTQQLQAFLEITAANELDVFRHNDDLMARYHRPLQRLLAGASVHLSAGARQAWEL